MIDRHYLRPERARPEDLGDLDTAPDDDSDAGPDRCDGCGKYTAYTLEDWSLPDTCRCCLGYSCDDTNATWRIADLGDEECSGEHYCKGCVAAHECDDTESRPLPTPRKVALTTVAA